MDNIVGRNSNMENHLIPWWRTDLGRDEISRIEEAILNRHITQGPVTAELESRMARFLGVPHVLLATNGATALVMALIACGVGPGDEVILPGLSFIATAHAPMLLGAKVKLVDVRADKPLIDESKLEGAINDRTRAIIPVHLNGRSVELGQINRLAEEHGLRIIEDAAQALGSTNRKGYLGTQSHIGCFSLSISKLITTGEGGALATASSETCRRLMEIRNNGVENLSKNRFDSFGFNFRQNDILSSIGLVQIEKIHDRIDALKGIYRFYEKALRDLPYLRMIEVDVEDGELPLWTEVLCAQRDRVIGLLRERRIEAKPFPPALCDSPHLKNRDDFKQSRFFAAHGMVLPSGPDQSENDLNRVIEALGEIGGHISCDIDSVIKRT